MEALAERPERDCSVLRWVDGLVVGSSAPHVGSRVNEPGGMEQDDVAEKGADVEGVEEGLVPEEVGDEGWDSKTEERDTGQVVAVLEPDNGIGNEVAKVDAGTLLLDIGVLLG